MASSERFDNLVKLQGLEKDKLKAKIKKRNKIIAVEGLAIVILVVLLL